MKIYNLNDNWSIRYEELSWGPEMALKVLKRKDSWLNAHLPCDVHMPLIENSIIKEPLEADNFFSCNWIEHKSWWFKKEFNVDEDFLKTNFIELILESLDSEADIFLNGFHLGHHRSAFYPFEKNVEEYLEIGNNVLLVRVSSGLEHVSDNDLAMIGKSVGSEKDDGRDKTGTRGDRRRVFVRKPQFAYGWDWGPRVATCGIMKGVYLQSMDKCVIRTAHAVTKKAGDVSEVNFEIQVENLHPYSTAEVLITLEILYNGQTVKIVETEKFLRSGNNYINIETAIENAKLWWPNGAGAQELYTAKVSMQINGSIVQNHQFKFGIRTVKLLQEKINGNERSFIFEINGVKIFCKGGNWIPADSIYARVTDEKYEKLILEAKEANFNMLRVWGGGLYEPDIFYEKCDEYGIMIWHDFMFGCGKYPDNLQWFMLEAEKEMDYQTTRLRNHPSIVCWCGNNECHWGFETWWTNNPNNEFYGGTECYNKIAPRIVQHNCPEIPYWNSSPYGGKEPNSSDAGDRHHWLDCTMHEEMEKRITPEEYDKVTAKFVSEYGYIGPCSKSSIVKYHAGAAIERGSEIWNHHNNTFEKDTVEAGITKHYTDAKQLDLDGYLQYAGLCQGLMYGYSLEALRFNQNCWGSLFWMYDDCWGEVGWTIIDYYLKRKISYYFVKRAFAPVKFIIREENGIIKVTGINDTAKEVCLQADYGYTSFDGQDKDIQKTNIVLGAHTRNVVLEFAKEDADYTSGCCFFSPKTEEYDVLPAVLRTCTFKELNIPKLDVEITDFCKYTDTVSFEVKSKGFVHAVHFNLDDNISPSDEYFDLLPGESRKIVLYNVDGEFALEDIKVNTIYNYK